MKNKKNHFFKRYALILLMITIGLGLAIGAGITLAKYAKTVKLGSLSVTINDFKIEYDLQGGELAQGVTNPGKYNINTATFTLNNPTRVGYYFAGWTGSNGNTPQVTVTIPKGSTGDRAYTAHWTPRTDTRYMVNHWLQTVTGGSAHNSTNFILDTAEELTGTTGVQVIPKTKTYTGFTAPATQTVTIAADGSTVVDYYYTRVSYTVTLNKGTGIAAVSGAGTYRYGASVTINATLSTDYGWMGWTGTHAASEQKYSFTMPAYNVANTANAAQPVLAAQDTWYTQGGTTVAKSSITTIELKNSYVPTGTVTDAWDASAAKDGSVMAYVEGNKLTIAGNGAGVVFANADSLNAFSNFTAATAINGISLLDTSNTTEMEKMFYTSGLYFRN